MAEAEVTWVEADGVTGVTFAPTRLRVFFDATSGARVRAHRASEVLTAVPESVAVMDGPMYADLGSLDVLQYAVRDPARGVLPGTKPGRGVVAVVAADGRVVWQWDGRDPGTGRVAVQLYPALVRDGRNLADATVNTGAVWRAALAELRDGRMLLAVGHGPMHAFAAQLVALGARHAGYSDGGGSTRLATRTRRRGDPDDRAVASWIYVEAAAPAGRSEAHRGRALGVAGVLGAALGVALARAGGR